MKLNLKNYIPKTIISSNKMSKEIKIQKQKNNYILSALKCKNIILPIKVNLSKEDIISIGLYFAEGSKKHNREISFSNSDKTSLKIYCSFLEKFNIKRTDSSWKVHLNINFKNEISETELSNYWIKELNLNLNSKRRAFLSYKGVLNGRLSKNSSKYGCLELSYSSIIFRWFLMNIMYKLFSEFVKNKDKNNLSYILKGYFAGDGHVSRSKNPKYKWRRHTEFLCNDLELRNRLKDPNLENLLFVSYCQLSHHQLQLPHNREMSGRAQNLELF